MDRSDLALVVPAYNEEETIEQVVRELRRYGTVIVVNDASTDRTAEKASQAGALVVRHETNRGYDAALDSGFAEAANLNCKYVITIDADGQHNPEQVKEYLTLLENSADLVLGVRTRKRLIAEYLFAFFTRLFYGIHDPLCGLKGYRFAVYRRLGYFDSYKSIGTELALFAVRGGFKFTEIPVPIRNRRGNSRFGWGLRANYKVIRSLVLAFVRR